MATSKIKMLRTGAMPNVELQIGRSVTGDVPRHWHEEYHLCAITGGYGELRYRGTTYPNPSGTLNLVEPGEVHSNHSHGSDGCDFMKLDFGPALFSMAGAEPPTFQSPTIDDPDTFRQFQRVFASLARAHEPIAAEIPLMEFLCVLLRKHARSQQVARPIGRERGTVRIVRDYLNENYARCVALAELTSLTGLSPFYLTRVFTREIGVPPHEYLNQVRILRAKKLIRERVPLSRVAQETGFADQSHLNRKFKHLVRVSPGVYKAAL